MSVKNIGLKKITKLTQTMGAVSRWYLDILAVKMEYLRWIKRKMEEQEWKELKQLRLETLLRNEEIYQIC